MMKNPTSKYHHAASSNHACGHVGLEGVQRDPEHDHHHEMLQNLVEVCVAFLLQGTSKAPQHERVFDGHGGVSSEEAQHAYEQ